MVTDSVLEQPDNDSINPQLLPEQNEYRSYDAGEQDWGVVSVMK